jgi:hypothetical protein
MQILMIPYSFVMMNVAAVAALVCYLTGRDVWRESRRDALRRAVPEPAPAAGGGRLLSTSPSARGRRT